MTENLKVRIFQSLFVWVNNSIIYFARWEPAVLMMLYVYRRSPTKSAKAAVIFLKRKTITERRRWRGRNECVALNKVCMTHATHGLKQSKHPPLSSCLLQLSPLLSHFFTIISSLSSIHVNPSPIWAKRCLMSLYKQQCWPMAQKKAMKGPVLACGAFWLSNTKPSLKVTGPSCLSQDLCPCCRFWVLVGGESVGGQRWKRRGKRRWHEQIKIGDAEKHKRRGSCVERSTLLREGRSL